MVKNLVVSVIFAFVCSFYTVFQLLSPLLELDSKMLSISISRYQIEKNDLPILRVVLNENQKKDIFKNKSKKIVSFIKNLQSTEELILDQKINFNKELREDIGKRGFISKIVAKTKMEKIKIKKEASKVIIPLIKIKESLDGEYSISSGSKFKHFGYYSPDIEVLDLKLLAKSVIKDSYNDINVVAKKSGPIEPSAQKERTLTPRKLAKKKKEELKKLMGGIKGLNNKDKLVYRFSANEKEAIEDRLTTKVSSYKDPKKNKLAKAKPFEKDLPEEQRGTLFEKSTVHEKNSDKDLVVYNYESNKKPSRANKSTENKNSKKNGPIEPVFSAPLIADSGVSSQNIIKKINYSMNKSERSRSSGMGSQQSVFQEASKERGENSSTLITNEQKYSENKGPRKENAKNDDYYSKGASSANSSMILSAFEFSLERSRKSFFDYFQVIFEDTDDDEYTKDGKIYLEENLNGKYGTRRVRVNAKNYITTILNLNFIRDEFDWEVKIPLFKRDEYYSILKAEQISEESSSLLIKLSTNLENVEISDDKSKKILIDGHYKVVNKFDEAVYALFLNVNPGNTYIRYKTKNRKFAFSEVHIKSNEVYYESNRLIDSGKFYMELEKISIMGSSPFQMDIFSKNISTLYGEGVSPKKVGINNYLFEGEVFPEGMRRSYRIYDEEEINIGTWDKRKIIIPSKEYRENIQERMDLYSFEGQCIVQVNLPKEASKVSFKGESVEVERDKSFNISRTMDLYMSAHDKDGEFYSDVGKDSKMLVFKGHGRGVINIAIDYNDSTKDYIQSYCDSNYTVEQL